MRFKVLTILLCFSAMGVWAQNIELSGFGGYMLNGKVQTYAGKYPVADAPNFGGVLGIELARNNFVELSYSRANTEFTYSRTGSFGTPVDVAIEYYQIGSSQVFDVHEVVKPFGGLTLGMTRFAPEGSYDFDGIETTPPTSLSDAWRFSAALGGGLKLMVSDKIGIRLQARLLLPMEFNGLFIGIGTGGGSAGASFRVPMVSGDFTGGLIIRLGNT